MRGVPFLSSLSEATVERLARFATQERAAAGTQVVEQGATGEGFYVIESGVVEVLVDGRRVTVLKALDYFGEIALLRDVPRTASVLAREDSVFLVLARRDFLPAVVGYAPSLASAEAVVARRLGARG